MKKILTLFILSLGILSLFFLPEFFNNSVTLTQEAETDEASGAYQALIFNAERQAYPQNKLPVDAYYRAWEKMTTNTAATRNGDDPLPWESIGPHNRGGRTLAMAFNPQNSNTLYAGSASGGLWRSYSAGQGVNAWEQVAIDFPILGVSCITFAPGDSMTMYIGTGEVYNFSAAGTGAAYRNTRGSWGMGILKTVDGGETWTKSLDWSYNQLHGIWAIKIAENNPNLIYTATTEGVYKSIDGGANWTLVLDVIMATDILVKPSDPNQVVATCGNFGTPGFGTYKTTDGGGNWTKIETGLPDQYLGKGQLAMAPSDEEIIYASIGNGFGNSDGASWLCRSDDFGSSWEIRNTTDYSRYQGWFAHDVAVSPTNPDYLVIIGINVWVSQDGGLSIFQESVSGGGYPDPPIEGPDGNFLYVHPDCHDVVFHPDNSNIVYVANDGGMHRSEDGGQTWHSTNGAYQTTQFYNGTSTSLVNEDIFLGGLQDNGTINWNGDLTWRRSLGADGSWTATHPTNENIFFNSYQNLNVQKSVNGTDFFVLNMNNVRISPVSFIAPYVIAPSNGNVLYSGSSFMGKSINQGINWSLINGGLPLDGNPPLSMDIAFENEDVVYVATAPYNGNRGHVFVTIDGLNFTDVTGDLPDRFPMDIAIDPTDEAVAYITFSGFGSGHVFKTEDYGGSWIDISEGLPDIPTNAVIVDPMIPGHVYVGNDFGVFLTKDDGANWESFQEGMPAITMVFDLKISPLNRKLRVATHGNGAYQRNLDEGPVSINQINPVISLKLFPNPSTGIFTIGFENPESQQIRIDVLDINGRFIRVLSNEMSASGNHLLNADISDLPKGVYLIRLGTKEASQFAENYNSVRLDLSAKSTFVIVNSFSKTELIHPKVLE